MVDELLHVDDAVAVEGDDVVAEHADAGEVGDRTVGHRVRPVLGDERGAAVALGGGVDLGDAAEELAVDHDDISTARGRAGRPSTMLSTRWPTRRSSGADHRARSRTVETLGESEVRASCRTNLGGFEQPTSADFIDEIPGNLSGKVLEKDLRAQYWDGQEGSVS